MSSVYVGFNYAAGINRGTKEAANQVAVYTQFTYAKSFLVAKLSQGQEYTMLNFEGTKSLRVNVKSINLGATLPVADVNIFVDDCPPGVCGPSCNACCSNSDYPSANPCVQVTCNQGACSYDRSRCPGNFQLNLRTDSTPAETSWNLMDQCTGQTRLSSPSYTVPNNFFVETATLGQSFYKLSIRDTMGNGIHQGATPGAFLVTFDGIEVAAGSGDFGREIVSFFGTDCSLTLPPTPALVLPTPAPVAPTQAPVEPMPAPVAPTSAPVEPTPAPVAPMLAPVAPVTLTLAPAEPTPAPVTLTLAPVEPPPAPVTSTLAPIGPTPVTPTFASVLVTPAPKGKNKAQKAIKKAKQKFILLV